MAGSRVKLKGRDILATWKVVCGMVLIPALHTFYTICVYYLYSSKEAVAYFFFMPFVRVVYVDHRVGERVSSVPEHRAAVHAADEKANGRGTREMRRILKRDVRELAQKLGWAEIIKKADSHNAGLDKRAVPLHVSGFPRSDRVVRSFDEYSHKAVRGDGDQAQAGSGSHLCIRPQFPLRSDARRRARAARSVPISSSVVTASRISSSVRHRCLAESASKIGASSRERAAPRASF